MVDVAPWNRNGEYFDGGGIGELFFIDLKEHLHML